MKGDRNSILEELAKRCEAATGPDRELDAAIAAAFRLKQLTYQALNWIKDPELTSSIDAAMTLVPEGWRIAEMGETVIECDDPWQIKLLEKLFSGERPKCTMGDAATPALALCAAALRSQQSKEG